MLNTTLDTLSYNVANKVVARYSRCVSIVPDGTGSCQQPVDLTDNPVKQSAVECLGHGVASGNSLLVAVVSQDALAAGHHRVQGQHLLELFTVQAQQMRHWVEHSELIVTWKSHRTFGHIVK